MEELDEPNGAMEELEEPNGAMEELDEPNGVMEELEEPNGAMEELEEPNGVMEELDEPNGAMEELDEPNGAMEELEEPNGVMEELDEPNGAMEELEEPNGVMEELDEPIVPMEELEEPTVVLKFSKYIKRPGFDAPVVTLIDPPKKRIRKSPIPIFIGMPVESVPISVPPYVVPPYGAGYLSLNLYISELYARFTIYISDVVPVSVVFNILNVASFLSTMSFTYLNSKLTPLDVPPEVLVDGIWYLGIPDHAM
jgi:hypothetical protein